MNKLFVSAAVLATAFAFTGCSDDNLVDNGAAGVTTPTATEGDFHTRITLALPERSSTDETKYPPSNSTDGYEIGLGYENSVGSVIVVLAGVDNATNPTKFTYITHSLASAVSAGNEANPTRPVYDVKFETRDLVENAASFVSVFTYCNPTADLTAKSKTDWAEDFANFKGNIEKGSISESNNFLMTNATAFTPVKLPTLTEMNETYNNINNPFFLGVVDVERVTARFDFKEYDGEGGVKNKYSIVDNSYPAYDEDGNLSGTTTKLMGYVVLDGKTLVTEAKEYYYLPRVASVWESETPTATLCGLETRNNFVVSPWYDFKVATILDYAKIGTHYRYSGFWEDTKTTDEDGNLVWVANYESLTYEPIGNNLGDDNDKNWFGASSGVDKDDYKIWKYVTENTIPGINAQRKGITTGVVFRGHIEAAEGDNKLGEAMNAAEVIYAYNGTLYGSFDMVKAVAASKPGAVSSTFRSLYATEIAASLKKIEDEYTAAQIEEEAKKLLGEDYLIFNTTEEYKDYLAVMTANYPAAVAGNTRLVPAKGFTIYRPKTENGKTTYPVYYLYLNRHNDNNLTATMGIMEFATVRNNIYKLNVTTILKFGHPGNPSDDPTPDGPGNEDETPETYFRVQLRVLPWVVRVNNITL